MSHQWVSQSHPDPDFRQMTVLHDVLRRFLTSSESVPKGQISEMFAAAAEALPMKEFQACSLFIWYDYFSVPQKEVLWPMHPIQVMRASRLCWTARGKAKCSLHQHGQDMARRGWTRLQRAVREMSPDHTWVLIQGSTIPGGSAGEGDFTSQEDRRRPQSCKISSCNRCCIACGTWTFQAFGVTPLLELAAHPLLWAHDRSRGRPPSILRTGCSIRVCTPERPQQCQQI